MTTYEQRSSGHSIQRKQGQALIWPCVFVVALEEFWDVRGHYSEARALPGAGAGARAKELTASVRARALKAAGGCAHAQGDLDRSEVVGESHPVPPARKTRVASLLLFRDWGGLHRGREQYRNCTFAV